MIFKLIKLRNKTYNNNDIPWDLILALYTYKKYIQIHFTIYYLSYTN